MRLPFSFFELFKVFLDDEQADPILEPGSSAKVLVGKEDTILLVSLDPDTRVVLDISRPSVNLFFLFHWSHSSTRLDPNRHWTSVSHHFHQSILRLSATDSFLSRPVFLMPLTFPTPRPLPSFFIAFWGARLSPARVLMCSRSVIAASRTGVPVTSSWPSPRARDQACIDRGVSYTLGLNVSWQPMCQGIRTHPRDVMEGEPTNRRTPRTEVLAQRPAVHRGSKSMTEELGFPSFPQE